MPQNDAAMPRPLPSVHANRLPRLPFDERIVLGSARACAHARVTVTSAAALVAGLALAPCAAAAAATTPACIDPAKPGPWFRLIRHEERHCDRESTPDDPAWFRAKNLALGATRWSFGGELRGRFESYDPVRAGLRGGVDDAYLQYRALLHADATFGDQWRMFTQLGYWNSSGRLPAPAPTDVDRGDVSQLFVEWRDGRGAMVRAGRQEVLLGSGRLVGIRHAPNIRLAFDGVRVAVPVSNITWEAFHLRPVALEAGAFDNRENSRERVAGLMAARDGAWAGLRLEGYAFRYEKPFQRYQDGAGAESRDVYGARLSGRRGRFTLNHEVTYQRGEVGDLDVRAWSVQTDTQWRWTPETPWLLGLRSSVGSGDRRAGDGRIGTFQPVYAAPPYFMQSSLVYPANLRTLQPYVEWSPTPRITVILEWQSNWREQTSDGYYQPPMVLQALDPDGRRIATQYGMSLRYAPRRDLLVEGWASRFEPTGPLRRAGADDTAFVAAMLTWTF